MTLARDDLRRFAERNWAKVAAYKADYWAEQYSLHGEAPARAASAALLTHMRRVQPDYPSTSQRHADLADHVLYRQRLDAAAHAFTRR